MTMSKQWEYLSLWQRRVRFTEQENFMFYRQNLGDEGEELTSKIIREIIPQKWYWLENVYFAHFSGHVQIDGLLISDKGVHLFEVKNLVGEYFFENGIWRKNGYELDRDFFNQTKRAGEIVRAILRLLNLEVPVRSRLVLASDVDNVKFMDVNAVQNQVLRRWELKPYIEKLIKENVPRTEKVNAMDIQDAIIKVKAETPAVKELDLKGRKIKLGILCENCDAEVDLCVSRYHAVCRACGYYENREKSILRSICEFSVLFPQLDANSANIIWFLNNTRLTKYVRSILNKYFKFSKKGRYHIYLLPGKKYADAFPSLKFRYLDHPSGKERLITRN